MTINEVLSLVKEIRPESTYTQEQLIRWLSELDGMVFTEILSRHSNASIDKFEGYGSENLNDSLLIPFPYDEAYSLWLCSKMDYYNEEITLYNADIALFNATYTAFEKYYTRNNMPLDKAKKFKF